MLAKLHVVNKLLISGTLFVGAVSGADPMLRPSALASSTLPHADASVSNPLILLAAEESNTAPAPPSASNPATLPDSVLRGWVEHDAAECCKSRDRLSLPDVYIVAEQHDRLPLWQETAKRGMAEGQVLLALCYAYGVGVESDLGRTHELLQAALENGNVTAMYYCADALLLGDGVAQDKSAAHDLFVKAADAGDKAAMWRLGALYGNGDGVSKNTTEALKWLEKSADAGAPYAMFQLGQSLFSGDLGRTDEAQGRIWIAKAADLACPFGVERLRQFGGNDPYMLPPDFVPPSDLDKSPHGPSIDTPQVQVVDPSATRTEPLPTVLSDDELRALVKHDADACRECRDRTGYSKIYIQLHAPARLPLWKEAARREIPEGLVMLGLCYTALIGFERNDLKKAELFRMAAEKGDPTAMHDYAVALTSGQAAPLANDQDGAMIVKAAVEWWKKAAELGEPAGMWHIADCYRSGRVVEKDSDAALSWYLKAANAGSAEAKFQLGLAFLSGHDMVPRDEVEGRRWLAKAAEGGFPKAVIKLRSLLSEPR